LSKPKPVPTYTPMFLSMSIEEMLTFFRDKGIRESAFTEVQKTVDPGKSIEWKADYDGWMAEVALISTSPYTRIVHDVWVGPWSYTLYELYMQGLTLENTSYNYIVKYDTTNNIYAMAYTPRPYKSFRRGNYVRITAPTKDEVTGAVINTPIVVTFLVEYIEIYNKTLLESTIMEFFRR